MTLRTKILELGNARIEMRKCRTMRNSFILNGMPKACYNTLEHQTHKVTVSQQQCRPPTTLPRRMLDEPTFPGMTSGHPLDQLLPRYYKIRGWDKAGIPTQKILDKLQVRS